MTKTSSSTIILQGQTDHQAVVIQSPPLITDHEGTVRSTEGSDDHDQNDQKAENDGGLKCKVDQMAVNDSGVERKKNNNSDDHDMCIIDIKNGDDETERKSVSNEKVCRICQLGSDHLPAGAGNVNFVLLGCACKGELGISHYYCAKAWFIQKGNRICEICGKPAKNIEGVENAGLRALEEEVNRALNSGEVPISSSTERNNRCAKSMCNFILAALILAFLLPWVFHPSKLL